MLKAPGENCISMAREPHNPAMTLVVLLFYWPAEMACPQSPNVMWQFCQTERELGTVLVILPEQGWLDQKQFSICQI